MTNERIAELVKQLWGALVWDYPCGSYWKVKRTPEGDWEVFRVLTPKRDCVHMVNPDYSGEFMLYPDQVEHVRIADPEEGSGRGQEGT